jgi:ribose transport system permease protein
VNTDPTVGDHKETAGRVDPAGRAVITGAKMPSQRNGRGILATVIRFQSLFGLVVVFVAGVAFSPSVDGSRVFLSTNNLVSIVRGVSEYGILAVGMTFVIIAGGIDLSVGAVLGLSGILVGTLMVNHSWNAPLAIVVVLLAGAALGWIQGMVSTYLRIQAFIVTLAGLQLALGLGQIVSGNKHIAIVSGKGKGFAPASFESLGGRVFGTPLPFSVVVFLSTAVVGALVLNTTRFGRHVFAVGGNAKAARLSGINVRAVTIVTFTICGLTAALGGIVDAGQFHFAGSNQGAGLELLVIASVVIGGTSLSGGEGTVVGTVAGALLLGVLRNILVLNNIDSSKQPIVTALIIVGAVVLQNVGVRRRSG